VAAAPGRDRTVESAAAREARAGEEDCSRQGPPPGKRETSLLIRIHFIIVILRWTGLALLGVRVSRSWEAGPFIPWTEALHSAAAVVRIVRMPGRVYGWNPQQWIRCVPASCEWPVSAKALVAKYDGSREEGA